ncbi:hypothetical protein EDD18DRAFT_1107291 [Armillaria luteobubalina]|uniref:Uncharacterized protein n=1 Tax=Armillaria luteobubalina TaxID=153913 RepID=A0AA39UMH6_9AGAR|nr:hypothetical protein EDD18DRAFT_1107291 [Armillaria luteobubalina]
MKQPPTGPSAEQQTQLLSTTGSMDDELAGYLSNALKWIIGEAEGQSSNVKGVKPCKKEGGKLRQVTILPCHIKYLAPRDGAAYLRDSRVHNKSISKGASVNDWLDFLTGTMGIKPTHPNTQLIVPQVDDSGSDFSDDDSGDSKPWHVKWHQNNPLPKNTPSYKLQEREVFLKVKQKKFDQRKQDHCITDVDGIPPSLPSAVIGGQLEHDNGFWGMLGPGFLYLCKYNIVLASSEAASTDEWKDIKKQFESLEPPEFIPLLADCLMSNPRNANHSAGLIYHAPHASWQPQYTIRDQDGYILSECMDWEGSEWDMSEDDIEGYRWILCMQNTILTWINSGMFYWIHMVYPPLLTPIRVGGIPMHRISNIFEYYDIPASDHTVNDWFHIGEHYVYKWLLEHPPPDDAEDAVPVPDSPPEPQPVTIDKDVEMGG